MTTRSGCRPVIGTTKLRLTGPGAAGQHIELPRPVGRPAARAVTLPSFTGANETEIAIRIRKIVTQIVIDRSGSMFCGAWGGDPDDVVGLSRAFCASSRIPAAGA